jgi:hypothetical protein
MIVHDAVISIVSNSSSYGKLVSLLALEDAFKQRYNFRDYLELTLTLISRVMTALVPDVDSLQQSSNSMYHIQHSYVVHYGKKKKIHFLNFLDKEKSPPKHPSIN